MAAACSDSSSPRQRFQPPAMVDHTHRVSSSTGGNDQLFSISKPKPRRRRSLFSTLRDGGGGSQPQESAGYDTEYDLDKFCIDSNGNFNADLPLFDPLPPFVPSPRKRVFSVRTERDRGITHLR
eukprot:GSA120T00001829001.1